MGQGRSARKRRGVWSDNRAGGVGRASGTRFYSSSVATDASEEFCVPAGGDAAHRQSVVWVVVEDGNVECRKLNYVSASADASPVAFRCKLESYFEID